MKSTLTEQQVFDFYKLNIPLISKANEIVKCDNVLHNYTSVTKIIKNKNVVNTINNDNRFEKYVLSIVMTTKNRQEQTMYTLNTIKDSTTTQTSIQIIIVDDSVSSTRLSIEQLTSVLLQFKCEKAEIIYVTIDNKFWVNPCVNYNIGFRFISSEITIIQNAEVCHMGNIIKYTINTLSEDVNKKKYLVFDVMALRNLEENKKLYRCDITKYKNDVVKNQNKYSWYQHHTLRNGYLHFLTALKSENLRQINGFDLDYCMATCFDDNALIDQLKFIGMIFENVRLIQSSNKEILFGIHQWHTTENPGMTLTNVYNQHLLYAKQKIIKETKRYPYLNLPEENDNISKSLHHLLGI